MRSHNVTKFLKLFCTIITIAHLPLYARKDFGENNDVSLNVDSDLRALYVNLYKSYGPRLQKIVQLALDNDFNGLVLDFKNEYGEVLYNSKAAAKFSPKSIKNAPLDNLKDFTRKLKEKGFYLIARVLVFKDNLYARQNLDCATLRGKERKNYFAKDKMAWVDPYCQKYWEYLLDFSKELAVSGIDEIQYDYIRFPDSSADLFYPNKSRVTKSDLIRNFLKKARSHLSDTNVLISADVFGLVASFKGEMSIGQDWDKISPLVDYISPMIYPSHYPRGFRGLKVPDNFPYETIKHAIREINQRNMMLDTGAKVRPWVQGFSATWFKNHKKYKAKELQEQIKALAEEGVTSYMIWNSASRYQQFVIKSLSDEDKKKKSSNEFND